MTDIGRVRVAWSGGRGGLGVSTFYFLDATTGMVSVHDFLAANLGLFPNEISLQVEPLGDVIDDANGNLVGDWSHTPLSTLVGTYNGVYNAAAGITMNWLTGTIVAGHRVRGKTFIVPCSTLAFSPAGGVDESVAVAVEATGQTLIEDVTNNLQVWHRPVSGAGGQAVNAAFAKISRNPAILRSRRD